jgi:hypothetical protein
MHMTPLEDHPPKSNILQGPIYFESSQ